MQPSQNLPEPKKEAAPGSAASASWERKSAPEAPGRPKWPLVLALAVVAAAGYFFWTRREAEQKRSQSAVAGMRTFTVKGGGRLDRTLLLTGQTGPEKYSSLLTPQLRGSRGQGGRSDGSSFRTSQRGGGGGTQGGGSGGGGAQGGGGGGGSTASASSGSGGSGSGGQASAAVASNNASANPSGASGGGMSAAMRSSTSRVGGANTASRSSASRAPSNSAASSGAMGSGGMGSTVGSLPGGGGQQGGGGQGGGGMRGGGMSEFMLVLQGAAPPGTKVKKGDFVAEFDRQYMLTRLDDYRASLTQAEASFKKLMAEIEVNKKAHNQTIDNAKSAVDKALLDMKTTPVLSSMDAERRRLALEEAQARLKQLQNEIRLVDIGQAADRRTAELELQQARLELKRAEANADRMVMKAPIDGLVVFQNTFRGSEFDAIKVGDQLFPGMMFVQIVDTSSMIINATINQADVEKLRIGQKAMARFDAFPGLELPAHVSAIGSVAKASRFRPDWVKEMAVTLKLDRMDPRVIPDLSVSCDVVIASADVPAVVPREGLFSEAAAAGGQQPQHFVFVRAADGEWRRRTVEVGLMSNTQASVKSGLKPGEVIALDRPAGRDAKPEDVSSNPSPSRAGFVALPAFAAAGAGLVRRRGRRRRRGSN